MDKTPMKTNVSVCPGAPRKKAREAKELKDPMRRLDFVEESDESDETVYSECDMDECVEETDSEDDDDKNAMEIEFDKSEYP